ncbi:TetR family transcriptional regulator [Nonomuraea sp. KM90]|uniref:TetR family transcriptional regulator n=1 Tax=Nonomuraea sp. KM90 TaxID=3457428 RepID=UPI003FCE0E88
MQAAQHLVQTQGYAQMSVQDVLAETGTSKGAFYQPPVSVGPCPAARGDGVRRGIRHAVSFPARRPDLPARSGLRPAPRRAGVGKVFVQAVRPDRTRRRCRRPRGLRR